MTQKPKFDDCLDVLDNDVDPTNDLSAFLGDDGTQLPKSDKWQEHWKGMPEFVQENKEPFKKMNVCFQTKEDFLAFRELLNQPMTEKTKTIWYPPFDREKNSLFSWIEDDAE